MAQRGVDLSYGRRLPRLLRGAGLVDVAADAFFPMTGSACNLLEQATVAQIRDRLVAAHLATNEEVDEHLANVAAAAGRAGAVRRRFRPAAARRSAPPC